MEELKVKNVVIGKQFETCENYEKFIKIVKEKKIKVIEIQRSKGYSKSMTKNKDRKRVVF